MMHTQKSRAFFEEVRKKIPLGSQTFSKSYLQFIDGAPLFLERGDGCRVWDIDGNEYIDMVSGLLPVLLGYRYPAVDNAIRAQLDRGITFSLPSPLEYEVAQMLTRHIPCAEMVRFGKNGSDATSGAVRLARAITKRDRVAVCGYHGWQDWYIAINPRNEGVPDAVKRLTHKFAYNNIASLEELFETHKNEFAAVVMEPMNTDEPQHDFLRQVQELCRRHGALFILDEIITGFRFHLGGAQTLFGITPDLATFGKSMANGMPIAAVVGKAEYMKKMEDIFFSFTFGGECLSLAAAQATIAELEQKDVIAHLWRAGEYVGAAVQKDIDRLGLSSAAVLCGKPCWQIWKFTDTETANAMEIKSFIQQEMLENGILWAGSHNWSYSHTQEDQDRLIAVYQSVLPKLKTALEAGTLRQELRYPPIQGNYNVRK